jgi:thiamine-phosphate diphosphorylase
MTANLAAGLRLLLVTDDHLLCRRELVEVCCAAVTGGVTAIQVRLKEATDAECAAIVRRLLAAVSVPVFVNDRFDLAVAVGAHGVHLGADDLPLEEARRRAPAGFWIGASVGSFGESLRAGPADYWGIGPLHPTSTKPDAGVPLGLSAARELRALAGNLPCVVIGGVRPADVGPALAAGFVGVAVSGGILNSEDVAGAARAYSKAERLQSCKAEKPQEPA